MFGTLDRAFLMARGHIVYAGAPEAAAGYFARVGLACPAHTALAEHMLASRQRPFNAGAASGPRRSARAFLQRARCKCRG